MQENQFNLLNGTFTEEYARDILATLFNEKIQYHRLKSFSHQERFGQPEPHAEERIAELKKTLARLLNYLRQYEGKTQFKIHADITINPVQ